MPGWRELVRRGFVGDFQAETNTLRSSRSRSSMRAALALSLVAVAVYVAGANHMLQLLRRVDPVWSVLGVALFLPQLALLALRWEVTASIVGAPIRYRYALREYALSMFLNQLPGFGIGGDVLRIARHAQRMKPDAAPSSTLGSLALAFRAVLLERISGQLVVGLWALGVAPLWMHALRAPPLATIATLCLALAALVIGARGGLGARVAAVLMVFVRDLRGLFSPRRTSYAHFALSLAITATIVVQLVCCARALDLTFPFAAIVRIVPFVLLSMVLPFTAGGWGTREATMAVLYRLSGMAVAEGVAISLAFGTLSALASVLGFLVFYRHTSELEARLVL